ncbi:MAG TPA: hypothetical protein VG318_03410, partial [Actinomycetota bacterium]|nr:hypothetical protein [Actinomycetota bacterium]
MASTRALRLAGAAALLAAALPVGMATPAAASWPGANGDIFVAEFDAGERNIVRYNEAGEVVDNIAGNLTEFSSFSLDADGERLVYSKAGEIWMLDLQTMDETKITESPGIERDPTFSFDGRY